MCGLTRLAGLENQDVDGGAEQRPAAAGRGAGERIEKMNRVMNNSFGQLRDDWWPSKVEVRLAARVPPVSPSLCLF